jgi:hypothetical protein
MLGFGRWTAYNISWRVFMAIYDDSVLCPCGSGRKLAECCRVILADSSAKTGRFSNMAEALGKEIDRRLADKNFSSDEEMQAAIQTIVNERNRKPLADFCGLSPREIDAMCRRPFASPWLVRFAERIDPPPQAPILVLYNALAQACAGSGLKATAMGNLPRSFVHEAVRMYWRPGQQAEIARFLGTFNEERFHDLSDTRTIVTSAGLLRKLHGRFHLTKKAKELATQGTDAIYRFLFIFYCDRFNWAYRDYEEELPIIQDSFLFTLYMLHRYGGRYLPFSFYQNKFVAAFPRMVVKCSSTPYTSAETKAHSIYSRRALQRFAWFFGLAEVKSKEDNPYFWGAEIRKNPLLERFVIFTPPTEAGETKD